MFIHFILYKAKLFFYMRLKIIARHTHKVSIVVFNTIPTSIKDLSLHLKKFLLEKRFYSEIDFIKKMCKIYAI